MEKNFFAFSIDSGLKILEFWPKKERPDLNPEDFFIFFQESYSVEFLLDHLLDFIRTNEKFEAELAAKILRLFVKISTFWPEIRERLKNPRPVSPLQPKIPSLAEITAGIESKLMFQQEAEEIRRSVEILLESKPTVTCRIKNPRNL